MPIEKFREIKSSVDPSSLTLNINLQNQICCSECGETRFTLRRVKDSEGRKIKPAKYVCSECYKNDKSLRSL